MQESKTAKHPGVKSRWLCDVEDCDQEWDIQIADEKYCFHHSKQKADMEEANAPYAKN